MSHRVLDETAVAEAIVDRPLQRFELITQPDDVAAGELGAMAFDDTLRFFRIVRVHRDTRLPERIDGHRKNGRRQVRHDDRGHTMRLEQPADDARLHVGTGAEDGDEVSHGKHDV